MPGIAHCSDSESSRAESSYTVRYFVQAPIALQAAMNNGDGDSDQSSILQTQLSDPQPERGMKHADSGTA